MTLIRLHVLALSVSILAASPVFAKETELPSSPEERVIHYEFEHPKTLQQALTLYHDSKQKIAKTLEIKALGVSELEAIHEQSYGLEAAIDTLREMKAYPDTTIDPADEAVQALHFASEKHQPALTREWFEKLDKVSFEK